MHTQDESEGSPLSGLAGYVLDVHAHASEATTSEGARRSAPGTMQRSQRADESCVSGRNAGIPV